MKTVRIGLLGLGTVARGVLSILRNEQSLLEGRSGLHFEVQRIFDRSYQKKADIIGAIPASSNVQDVLNDPDIDIVVELIGGLEPAREYIDAALKAGKSVVTANKAVLARHGNQIFKTARESGVEIGFEAAVAAALPVIQNMRRGLIGNSITSLTGILNGTCNFILTRMAEENMDYAAALKMAQELGFAEADPEFDVEGKDAAQKLAIISALAFDTAIREDAVQIQGITQIQRFDLEMAASMQSTIRLIACASSDPLQMWVAPALLSDHHPLFAIRDEKNAVLFETNNAGPQLIMGNGAGSLPTASAVVSDLVAIARTNPEETEIWLSGSQVPPAASERYARYYLRFTSKDRAGVLADIARTLANHQISIAQVHQAEGEEPVHLVVITHRASSAKLAEAVTEIDRNDFIVSPTLALPIEGQHTNGRA